MVAETYILTQPRIPEFFEPWGRLHTMILLTPMLRYSRVKTGEKEAARYMSSDSHKVYRLSVNKSHWEVSIEFPFPPSILINVL